MARFVGFRFLRVLLASHPPEQFRVVRKLCEVQQRKPLRAFATSAHDEARDLQHLTVPTSRRLAVSASSGEMVAGVGGGVHVATMCSGAYSTLTDLRPEPLPSSACGSGSSADSKFVMQTIGTSRSRRASSKRCWLCSRC